MMLVLGLGSNLGDRRSNLTQAVGFLEKSVFESEVICSSVYETKALLKEGSPKSWDINFYNMVVKGNTKLNPWKILNQIKDIEVRLGRADKEIWAPREIDIDILAFGSKVIIENNLVIPHKELLKRKWCVIPFAEIYRKWYFPVQGSYYKKTIKELSSMLVFNNDYFSKLGKINE